MRCHFAAIMASFSVEAMVRVYKDIWATIVSEELPCQRENGNRADPFIIFCVLLVLESKFHMGKNFCSLNFHIM